MLISPTAALSPASRHPMLSPPNMCGSSIPPTPGLSSEVDGQACGPSRQGICLLYRRGLHVSDCDETYGPAFKRPRIQRLPTAPHAARAACASLATTVSEAFRPPSFHPPPPISISQGSARSVPFSNDVSPPYLYATGACLERYSSCPLSRLQQQLQHQQAHHSHHHQYLHYHHLPSHQRGGASDPSRECPISEANGFAPGVAATAVCPSYPGTDTCLSGTRSGPIWNCCAAQTLLHPAPPPLPLVPPQQYHAQQPHGLHLQLLLTVRAAQHQGEGVAEPPVGLPADFCQSASISHAAPLRLADTNQLHPRPREQQRKEGHWPQLPPQPPRLHLQLALRPLGCKQLSPPLPAPPPPPPPPQQQQQQRWQPQPPQPHHSQHHQPRPCIPFFAPTTPPLDADAPSECILLLCKTLSMSEGTTGRLALHIWNRIRGLVHLLVSVCPQAYSYQRDTVSAAPAEVASAAASRVYSVAAVWLAAKLEETRREIPTVHTLAATARTLPSVLIAAEMRVLQWCDWSPYLGFVPDDSHLLIDL